MRKRPSRSDGRILFASRFVIVSAAILIFAAARAAAAQGGAEINMAPFAKSGTAGDDVRAAERGDALSQFQLGFRYYSGFFGIPQDRERALLWFRRAADQGLAIAQATLGGLYEDGELIPHDYERAAMWYRRAAEQGFTGAQFDLGALYAAGRGVPQDGAEAATWYRRAAEHGHVEAQLNLALLYDQGFGVTRDEGTAVKWFRRAADGGNATAQFLLGEKYRTGHGVAANPVEALRWMILAETRAPDETQQAYAEGRAALARQMRLTQIREAERRARQWTAAFNRRG